MGIHQRSKLGNPRVAVTREGGEEYYQRRATKNVLHPIVRTHPVSGRLYVSPRFTVGIEGMDDAEAQPLLDTLFAYQTAPGNTYRHKWTLGDFVMWDNRSVNHQTCGGYAMDDIRLLHRTSTQGDQPFCRGRRRDPGESRRGALRSLPWLYEAHPGSSEETPRLKCFLGREA